MKHTIIYISGLGDSYDAFRSGALKVWRFFGVDARLLPMQWNGDETYEQKYQRASDYIKQLLAQNRHVTLIGESAGATMAIHLFARHPAIRRLMPLAGVAQSNTPVSSYLRERSPAFSASIQALQQSHAMIPSDRFADIHTVSALSDMSVRYAYSHINGAHNHRVWSLGHLTTIALCLTIYMPYMVSLVKKK